MIPPEAAHVVLPVIVAASIALMLIRPRGIPEVWWISGGAIALIILRLMPLKLAGQAVAKGSDVYLFLIGMMLLSELARSRASSIGSHLSLYAEPMAAARVSSYSSMEWERW